MTEQQRRAFIRCPLEAALAAKNFRMKFYVKFPNYDCPFGAVCLLEDDVSDAESAIKYIEKAFRSWKIYIKPESLPLLEPQIEDIVEYDGFRVGYIIAIAGVFYHIMASNDIYSKEMGYLVTIDKIDRIIQRKGHAFPKIEWEEY